MRSSIPSTSVPPLSSAANSISDVWAADVASHRRPLIRWSCSSSRLVVGVFPPHFGMAACSRLAASGPAVSNPGISLETRVSLPHRGGTFKIQLKLWERFRKLTRSGVSPLVRPESSARLGSILLPICSPGEPSQRGSNPRLRVWIKLWTPPKLLCSNPTKLKLLFILPFRAQR